jgi:hypothetical protein
MVKYCQAVGYHNSLHNNKKMIPHIYIKNNVALNANLDPHGPPKNETSLDRIWN